MALAYRNPVYPDYFADPFVFKHGDRWYAVGTGPEEADPARSPEERGGVFPLLVSRDFFHWEAAGHALHPPYPDPGPNFWAPEIACADGSFFLYYAAGNDGLRFHLRVAASTSPLGPYRDLGVTLTDPDDCPFAIDAHPFRDADGRWWMFYARDFPDPGPDGARAGTALAAQPMVDMVKLGRVDDPGLARAGLVTADGAAVVLRARHDWQRFQAGRKMYGRILDWHTLEGPAVLRHGGRYYCLYSGGRWEGEGYGVDYAVADRIIGPYSGAGGEGGPRILRTVAGRLLGPGHNSAVEGPDGRTWLAYHAWDPGLTARRLCVDPLVWTPQGPRLAPAGG